MIMFLCDRIDPHFPIADPDCHRSHPDILATKSPRKTNRLRCQIGPSGPIPSSDGA